MAAQFVVLIVQLIQLAVTFAVAWGPELAQALVFAHLGLSLTGLARDVLAHWIGGVIVYLAAFTALERYFPRLTYFVHLALCGLWIVLPVIALANDRTLGHPVYLAIAAVIGGLLGSRVNFGSMDALPAIVQQEGRALAGAFADWRARQPATTTGSSGSARGATSPPRAQAQGAPSEPPRSRGPRHSPPPRDPPRSEPPPRARTQAREQQRAHRQDSPPPPPPGPPDAWAILGVPYGATPQQIRRAYLDLMRRYHPDRIATLGPELRELAEHKAKEINRAYETLRGRR